MFERMFKNFYGPSASFSQQSSHYLESKERLMQMFLGDNAQYRCNMGLGIAFFFLGYGISLSGHTLYKMFSKQHKESSDNDDEEWWFIYWTLNVCFYLRLSLSFEVDLIEMKHVTSL